MFEGNDKTEALLQGALLRLRRGNLSRLMDVIAKGRSDCGNLLERVPQIAKRRIQSLKEFFLDSSPAAQNDDAETREITTSGIRPPRNDSAETREIATAIKNRLVMTSLTLALALVFTVTSISESFAATISCINGIREDGTTACEKCGTNCNWEIKNGQLTVSGTGATYDYNYREYNHLMSTAPWSDYSSQIKSIKIEGLTSIGSRAFKGLTSVSDVFIADTVESIGAIAFADNTFSSLAIPSSVNFVGNWAFGNNPNLKELIISDNLTYEQLSTWGDDAFNSSNQWLETIKCFGNLETCQKNLKKYLSKSVGGECLSMCLKDSIKFLSVSKDQCNNAGKYYWDGNRCNNKKDGIICASGYFASGEKCVKDCANGQVEYKGKCLDEYPFARKFWTPSEAAKWLNEDNNEVILTFKK